LLRNVRGEGVAGLIAADLARLEQAEAQFGKELARLRKLLAELDHGLRDSLARWSGEASRAYWRAHAEWMAAAEDMAERLASLHQVIGAAHRNYGKSLGVNLAMWDAT
jgi:WXG100 family type VII secretion target